MRTMIFPTRDLKQTVRLLAFCVSTGAFFLMAAAGWSQVSTDNRDAVEAFGVAPSKGAKSVFFSDRARSADFTGGATLAGPSTGGRDPSGAGVVVSVAAYPRALAKINNDDEPPRTSRIFIGFFTDMFASVNLGPVGKRTNLRDSLDVSPPTFSLNENSEVVVTYKIKNPTRKIIRFDYSTAQHFDIVVTDAAGEEIDRWSKDRIFVPDEGVLFLNPGERLEYSEQMPTAKLKPNEKYIIKGEAAENLGHEVSKTITPR